jgi:hypothetical protein
MSAGWCRACQELRALLETVPVDPKVVATFAKTYLIRVDIDQWPHQLFTIGLDSLRGIPVVLAVDTTGRVTDQIYGDEWGEITPEGLSSLRHFFQNHLWTRRHRDLLNTPTQ